MRVATGRSSRHRTYYSKTKTPFVRCYYGECLCASKRALAHACASSLEARMSIMRGMSALMLIRRSVMRALRQDSGRFLRNAHSVLLLANTSMQTRTTFSIVCKYSGSEWPPGAHWQDGWRWHYRPPSPIMIINGPLRRGMRHLDWTIPQKRIACEIVHLSV